MVRGAQLAIVKKLPSEYTVEIQTTLLSWMLKKISVYESTKNKRGKASAIGFFKALQVLLVGIGQGEALRM